jgi:MFS family permease
LNLIFSNPQFRLLWLGFSANGISGFMLMMVQGWLTLQITDSAFMVGVVAAAAGGGAAIMSIPGGVLADRVSRRRILILGTTTSTAGLILLAAVVLADAVQIWHIITFAAVGGLISGLQMPASMALTVDIAGKPNLLKATAANFGGVSVAGVVGPLVAGQIIERWGIGWGYVLVVVIQIVVIILYLMLREPQSTDDSQVRKKDPAWQSMKAGAQYVLTTPTIRSLILLGLVSESFAWSHIAMLPVIADRVLHVGADGLGYLQSAAFVGLFVGSVVLASVRTPKRQGLILVLGLAGFCGFLILFALSTNFVLSLALIGVAYIVGATYDATLSTLIQTSVPDRMRGRVISFQTLTWSINGVSGFHMGALASLFTAPIAIIIGASVTLVYLVRVIPMAKRIGVQEESVEENQL